MSDVTQVVFNTASYPYPHGEQFIESEIVHWACLTGTNVVILPSTSSGTPRTIPSGIGVQPASSLSAFVKISCAMQAFVHPLLWEEFWQLHRKGQLNATRCFLALKSVAFVLREKADISRRLRGAGPIDLAYSYWNNETAYALCLLKREGRIRHVISRAHRYDLYEEKRKAGYMPVKRQLVDDFDCVYGISNDACIYLGERYGFAANKLQVARLGVSIPEKPANASTDGVVRMLSVSFCVEVKRIHKIVEAICQACSANPGLVIDWVHIGGGPLRQDLEATSKRILGTLPNARFRFAGVLSNKDVLQFLSDNPVDVFINSSASEGIPVSIMEAMAFGVPAIAPAVGGVPELVNDGTGVLLSAEMHPAEVYAAICTLTGEKAEIYRTGARQFVEERYSASRNYSHFVSQAVSLAERPDA